MYLWISWVILGLHSYLGDTLYRGKCQSEAYFEAVLNNSRLKHHVISTQDVPTLEDCVMACLSDEHCSSYNFQVSGNPLHKCELNFKSRSSAQPGSLVLEQGYQDYEIIDSKETEALCETIGCENEATCEENCKTLASPHSMCKCPSPFAGEFCEERKTGDFLLEYNSSTTGDHTSVTVTGKDFNYLAVYVWVKPRTHDGVVFTFATQNNPKEIALLFNETNVLVHVGGQIIPFDIALPVKKWSQILFTFHDKMLLKFYCNGLLHKKVNINQETTVKGTGILVPAFEQISPGRVNGSSVSFLAVTRLYVLDGPALEYFEILRLVNEPYFSVFNGRKFRVDWREFYQIKSSSNTSALVSPSKEPDTGNFDLRFPGSHNVTIDIPYIPPLDTFVLSMWIRMNSSHAEGAIFQLGTGSGTVLKLKRQKNPENLEFQFFLIRSNSTVTLLYPKVITNEHWHHLLFHWKNKRIGLYKDGCHLHERFNPMLNVTLPEIHNGTIKIGDGDLVGDVTSLNMWSRSLQLTMHTVAALALNPGNAAGDLFSWKSLKERSYLAKHAGIVPSTCHQRPGQFDLIFPERDESNMNYISLESLHVKDYISLTAVFWIKIPPSEAQFTLISYAIPSDVNHFSVHFGTTGIWVYLHGNIRFIPLMRFKLVEKWHNFVFSSKNGQLSCFHNGQQIAKDKVEDSTKVFIAKDAVLVVGGQQSQYKVVNDAKFQFTGELSQLQIYRRYFSNGMIRTLADRCSSIPGNLFRWTDMPDAAHGQVRMRDQSECFKAKTGEE